MSSRLFTNVRELHGLCYAVYASYETFKDRASIVAYAGAVPEKAQETSGGGTPQPAPVPAPQQPTGAPP